ncbi:hypothetical protein D3C72_1627140 [compost metagenome]
MHDQRGVDLLGRRIAQQHQLLGQLFDQRLRRGRIAEHEPHLVLHVHRLGERAQVQPDHDLLQPGPGFGDEIGAVRGAVVGEGVLIHGGRCRWLGRRLYGAWPHARVVPPLRCTPLSINWTPGMLEIPLPAGACAFFAHGQ